jgi:class 3 adenylate cyclase
MTCPRCGAYVSFGKRFCGDCGMPLPWHCNVCGGENAPGKRFCGDCGASQAAGLAGSREGAGGASARAPVVAERRQLTVMFADLVGSTALGVRLDPEDLREVIGAYHGCVTSLIARADGFVARYMGDGVLVYFGYPQAHEDDAERAMRAGLEIVDAVRRLATVAGPPGTLDTRVGIATGLVVVGDLIGIGSSRESAVVGDTPNLAARLQSVAEPGQVVVADATQRLGGGLFEYRDLGPASVKGLGAPIRSWVVLGESSIDSRFEALRHGEAPLVGRAEEISLLLRRWHEARSGEGRAVLLSGEPGIGKSRLIAALEQEVREARPARLRFLCSAHYQDTPLHPIVRFLERHAKVQRGDAPEDKRNKLRRAIAPGLASATDLGVIAELLSIPGLAGDASAELSPQRRKEMTFAALLRLFDGFARQGPVLAELEDIHWADPTTLDLLDLLIERTEHLPMLLVITTRPEVQPVWATRPHVTVRVLGGLNRRMAACLIKGVMRDRSLPDDVVERIIARADGVPLFIEALTETVLEAGGVGAEGGPAVERVSADMVPASLQASLMARLDRLAEAKEIAQIGSVIGREFSFEMLHALSGRPAARLAEALRELSQSGLVIAHGEPPDASYSFKHALVQDAAYASLLRERRRAMHLRLAEALEADSAGTAGTEPQLLAFHFAEAGAADRAIDYYLRAAEHATGRFALGEMVSHLHKALRQRATLPDTAETLRRELALQVALGRALIDHQGSGSEQVRAAFERARELCLALDDTRQLLRVLDGLMNYHFTHSQPKQMLGHAHVMLEIGRRTGDQQAFLMARRSAGYANLLLGRLEAARDEMQLLLAIYDAERDGPRAALTTRDPKIAACTVLGICLTAMGFLESGSVMSREGVRHADSLNHVVSLVLALRRSCLQRMMVRDLAGAAALSGRLLAMDTEYQTFLGTREGMIFKAWADLQTRRDPVLLQQVQTWLDELDTAKHWVMLPFFMASIGEVIGEGGDPAGAVGLLRRAAELVEATGEQWCEAEILRLRGLFGARDQAEGEALLAASLAKAREQGARLWELRTATSLARLWGRQGRCEDGLRLLAPVHDWFSEGLHAPDVVAARVLLEELTGRPG